MVSAHPSIAWQMNKNRETIAFVTEASVAYFTRVDDFRGNERDRLRQEIERLVLGEDSLHVEMDVDDWLSKMRTPKQMRDSPPPRNAFGANPPPGLEWQIGKTVVVLDFVREAEHALATQGDLDADERYKLEAKIDRLKRGSESLGVDETLDSWLERLRDHYP